jgi:Transcription factor WhiB
MSSSFVDVLNARQWTEDAACRDDPNPDRWFAQGTSGQSTQPGDASPTVLELMLTCVRCPVRIPCLEDALTPHPLGGRAIGVWAGTTTLVRHRLRKLPISEAVAALEAGLAERVRRRVLAVEKKHPSHGVSAVPPA